MALPQNQTGGQTAAFGPCFHLPGQPILGTGILGYSHIALPQNWGSLNPAKPGATSTRSLGFQAWYQVPGTWESDLAIAFNESTNPQQAIQYGLVGNQAFAKLQGSSARQRSELAWDKRH